MQREGVPFGAIIEALPGTTTEIFSEGRRGVVTQSAPEGGMGLVRWGGDTIMFGFYAENVQIINSEAINEAR